MFLKVTRYARSSTNRADQIRSVSAIPSRRPYSCSIGWSVVGSTPRTRVIMEEDIGSGSSIHHLFHCPTVVAILRTPSCSEMLNWSRIVPSIRPEPVYVVVPGIEISNVWMLVCSMTSSWPQNHHQSHEFSLKTNTSCEA